MSVEIACDESGFTGGNLTFRHTVFTHASLRVPVEIACDEMARLRSKVAAHGELKASWLLRWCDDDDLHRLLDPGGLLGDQVRVHLTDTRLFLLCRLADVLLGTDEVSGLDLPGEAGAVREVALELYRQGDTVFGLTRWQAFLTAAGKALRATSRWVPATAVSDFEAELSELVSVPAPTPVREALLRLRAAAGRARALRRSLEVDSRRPPLLEPLLPALTRCVLGWGAAHRSLVVVHDEQSALTPWRIAEMARRLDGAHPGHVLDLRRVDSRDDPRVQIADLVAGIARRAAASLLIGRPESRLVDLISPVVDPRSVWPDDAWREGLSRRRRPASLRGGTDRPSARPA
ncbi:MAG TPA: hypothetical protein VEX57_05705 [Microlunatus sp.]|jgi:hypothetical protein|nr:hypothetical protein [Microlunatus sp.]